MATNVVRFLLLVLLSLLVGTMVGIWVGYNPIALSVSAYVEQQQNAIRAFNTLLPVMGGICIILTAVLAFRAHLNPRVRYLHVAAAICMVIAAVVTRFGNQPINAVVMTWSAQTPAANWTQLRDVWWQWHVVRSIFGIGALALTFLAVLASKRVPAHKRN
jgi:uncharacterized membrane protein